MPDSIAYPPDKNGSNMLWLFGGVLLLFIGWSALALIFDEIIIASPSATFQALGHMLFIPDFWKTVWQTFERLLLGIVCGSIPGFLLGLAAGLDQRAKRLFEPITWVQLTIPPAVLVVISMIWFGMGSIQTIFVTALLVMPIIYVNTITGMEAVDPKLIEMAKIYRMSTPMMLRQIYLPGVGGHVLAGLTLSAGMGIRIVVLAELLGASSGIGYEFALARINLDTPALFAWITVCLFVGGVVEFCGLRPLKHHLMKWKQDNVLPQ